MTSMRYAAPGAEACMDTSPPRRRVWRLTLQSRVLYFEGYALAYGPLSCQDLLVKNHQGPPNLTARLMLGLGFWRRPPSPWVDSPTPGNVMLQPTGEPCTPGLQEPILVE